MPIFDGVHGTKRSIAELICCSGFILPNRADGYSMYGNGIYFFEASPLGRKSAIRWAAYKWVHDIAATVCTIVVPIDYADEDAYYFNWSRFEADLALICKGKNQSIDNNQKNKIRAKYIQSECQKLGLSGRLAFTSFMPSKQKATHVPGCVVYDIGILPQPSEYRLEVPSWTN